MVQAHRPNYRRPMDRTSSASMFNQRRCTGNNCCSIILRSSIIFCSVFLLNSCSHVEQEYQLQSWEGFRIAAEKALKKNQHKFALSMAQESVAAAESFGDADFRLGVSLCVLGDAQKANRRTKAAEAAYKKSIIVLENSLQKNKTNPSKTQTSAAQMQTESMNKLLIEDQSESLSHLGDLYMAQDKYIDAARCFDMATTKLQGLLEQSQANSVDMVMQQSLMNCLLGLARASAQAEKFDLALQSYQRAIFLAAKTGCGELARRDLRDEYLKFLKEHNDEKDAQPLLADLLFSRYSSDGGLALSEGDFTAAEIAFRNALVQAGRSIFSEQRVLHAISNLVTVFAREGKTADLTSCAQLAKSFMMTHPQANQKDYDHIQESLSNYYLLSGFYAPAQDVLASQLEYRVRQFGKQSKEVCTTYAMLGLAANQNHNLALAQRCVMKAYRIINAHSGDRSFFYAMNRTAELFVALGSHAEAEELHKRMIAIQSGGHEKGDPFLIGMKVNLLVLYQRYQQRAEFNALLAELIEEIKNANSTQRAGAFPYLLLALSCSVNAGWYDLAEPVVKLCREILNNDLGGAIQDEQLKISWLKNVELVSKHRPN